MSNNKNSSVVDVVLKAQDLGVQTLSKMGNAIAKGGELMASAYGLISGLAALSISGARKSEESFNSLNGALIRNGLYTPQVRSNYLAYAKEISKTSEFSQGAVVEAESILQGYFKQKELSPKLLKATADFAAGQGIDLASAANVLGKSLSSDSTNMLARYGVQIDESLPIGVKTEQAIKALEDKFGGQSEASLKGLGALKKMTQALEKVFTIFGNSIKPVIVAMDKDFTKLSQDVQTNSLLLQQMDQVIEVFLISTNVMKNLIEGAAKTLYVGGTATFNSVVALAARGGTVQPLEVFLKGLDDVSNVIKSAKAKTLQDYNNLQDQIQNKKELQEKQELDKIRLSNQNALSIQKNLIITQEQTFAARDEEEIRTLLAQESLKTDSHLRNINLRIQNAKTQTEKLALDTEKRKYLEQKYWRTKVAQTDRVEKIEALLMAKPIKDFQDDVIQNFVQMQNSNISSLVEIAKMAAIIQTELNAIRGASAAYKWCNQYIPYIGDIIGWALAALVILYGKEQEAKIAGIDMWNPSSSESIRGTAILQRMAKLLAAPWEDPQVAAQIAARFGAQAINSLKGFWKGAEINKDAGWDPNHDYGHTGEDRQSPVQNSYDFKGFINVLSQWGEWFSHEHSFWDYIGKGLDPIGAGDLPVIGRVLNPLKNILLSGGSRVSKTGVNITVIGGLTGSESELKDLAFQIHNATMQDRI